MSLTDFIEQCAFKRINGGLCMKNNEFILFLMNDDDKKMKAWIILLDLQIIPDKKYLNLPKFS